VVATGEEVVAVHVMDVGPPQGEVEVVDHLMLDLEEDEAALIDVAHPHDDALDPPLADTMAVVVVVEIHLRQGDESGRGRGPQTCLGEICHEKPTYGSGCWLNENNGLMMVVVKRVAPVVGLVICRRRKRAMKLALLPMMTSRQSSEPSCLHGNKRRKVMLPPSE
jgi:hypothetical protein